MSTSAALAGWPQLLVAGACRARRLILLFSLAGILQHPLICCLGGTEVRKSFDFSQDTFAYANELAWEYRPDEATGRMRTWKRDPAPAYRLHCFAMALGASQFYRFAQFDPSEPNASDASYRHLIRLVFDANPRISSEPAHKIVFPGYSSLRQFSAEHESLLKQESGPVWRSYFQRGNWRMVFPFTRKNQERTATHLTADLRAGNVPIVHLVCFPNLSLNHGILLFSATESANEIRFEAYDPNNPATSTCLSYNRTKRLFTFPSNAYFSGGQVKVYQIFSGPCS